jgi:hypothetical protein
MNKMRNRSVARYLGWSLLLLATACEADRTPTAPTVAPDQPSLTVTYDNGWDGYLEDTYEDYELITCPAWIAGAGVFPYDSRWWYTVNGPYVTISRTLTKSRYARPDRYPIVFAATDGARAAADWFDVGCKPLLGVPMMDIRTFAPGNWVVTYVPPPSGGGDDGGGGECETQLIYDPTQPCPGGGGGGGGDGSGGDDGSGDGGGGGSNCHTEYIIIEISYDGGETWSVWWEGYATVCE